MNLPGRGILHLLVEQGSLNLEVQGGEFRVPQHDKHPITSHLLNRLSYFKILQFD